MSSINRWTCRRLCMAFLVTFLMLIAFYSYIMPCTDDPDVLTGDRMVPGETTHYTYNSEHRAFPYERNMPLIFVGGIPRSGTTLMRAMLDAHPEVRCGEETRVIPRLLGMRSQWSKSTREATRLEEAGLSDDVLDSAIAAFILEVIARHGEPAPRLCNKDPFTLNSSVYLAQMFPSSKFILMVRDGRAVVHSIITRKVTISGFDLKSYRNCLQKWNQAMESMYFQCMKLGQQRCMIVFYEQMVLHPKEWMQKILSYLDVPWDDAVLHHDQFINIPGGVSLSKTERSTSQVIKPVNLEALTRWVGAIPEDVKRDMRTIAPMLERLGYDPSAAPPNYGDADNSVQKNTAHIKEQHEYWKNREKQVQNHDKKHQKVETTNEQDGDQKQTVNNDSQLQKSDIGKILQNLEISKKRQTSINANPQEGSQSITELNNVDIAANKEFGQETRRHDLTR